MSQTIDPDFCPRTYFRPQKLDAHLLSKVKGSVLRKRLQELLRQGRTEELRALLEGPGLTDEDRQALERIHPMFMGGNYLPEAEAGEVEIARITLRSTTFDVTSVLARVGDGTIHYRVVDEYGGDTLQGEAEAESTQPMSLRALVAFVLRAWPLMEVLESNFEDNLEEALAFFRAESEFYPDLDAYLSAQVRQHYEALREDEEPEGGGDTCPVCNHFNSPPADDLCEHACGWEWDGQFEPLGRGQVFAAALRELATEVQRAQEDPDRQRILQWLSRADQERQQLIELALEGPQEALTDLADAETGDGWSTQGMVGGSGHTVYVEQPSRLDELAARCRSVAQACSVQIQTQDAPDAALESLRPRHNPVWELVASGGWAEDVYHGGHVAYWIAPTGPGTWILEAVARNAVLDGVTEEDVEEGRLNDDQIQAMWGMTLEEAQEAQHREIVAACSGVGEAVAPREVAALLYWAVCENGGREITEPDDGEALVDVGDRL